VYLTGRPSADGGVGAAGLAAEEVAQLGLGLEGGEGEDLVGGFEGAGVGAGQDLVAADHGDHGGAGGEVQVGRSVAEGGGVLIEGELDQGHALSVRDPQVNCW
jgi:hypothetical protein